MRTTKDYGIGKLVMAGIHVQSREYEISNVSMQSIYIHIEGVFCWNKEYHLGNRSTNFWLTIFKEFSHCHRESIHCLAYDCENIYFQERLMEFEKRGFRLVQSWCWLGRNHFALLETDGASKGKLANFQNQMRYTLTLLVQKSKYNRTKYL